MTFIREVRTKSGIYLHEVRSVRKNGKVVQEYVRSIGKKGSRGEVIPSKWERLKVDGVLMHGNLIPLKLVSEELGLGEVLDEWTAGKGADILALVFAHCIDPISLNRIQKFLCKVDVEYVGIGEVKTSTLRRDLDRLTESERAIHLIEEELFQKVLELYPIDPSSIFYDITSIYFNGSSCKLAKLGQNSQHIRKPQINVGLVVTQEGGFPVFHRVFDGNVADVKTLEDAARCLHEMKIENCTLIMDRGFYSRGNLTKARELGFEVIAGIPLRGGMRQKAIDAIEYIARAQNRVMLKSGYLYVREIDGEARQFVCLNDKERVSIREARYREIDDAIRLLGEGKAIKKGLRKYIIEENGSWVPDQKAIEEAELTDGAYVIMTTRKDLSAGEVIHRYFEKDRIEKAFRTLKSVLSIEPVRSWLKGQVKAHIFVCYLAYLIFSVIEWKMIQAKIDLSAMNVLEELESAYKVVLSDPVAERRWDKIVTFSKKQESILKALGYKDV